MSKYAGSGTITSVAPGDSIVCSGTTLLQCAIAGTATAAFQVKGADNQWRALVDGATTYAGEGMWFVTFPSSVRVRLNVSAWTSGDVDWQIVSTPVPM